MPLFDESVDIQNVVTVTGTLRTLLGPTATSAITRVPVNVTASTTLLNAATRAGAIIFNESSGTMLLKFGTTASATSYTYRVLSNQTLEVEYGYSGRIDAILTSGSGNAQITEVSV